MAKLTVEYKWRRLRRWLNEVKAKSERNAKDPQLVYHWRGERARAEAFSAVLHVMDMESRRARKRNREVS